MAITPTNPDPNGTLPQPEVPVETDERTKAELLEQARDLEIAGRSKMDRDELAAAVDSAANAFPASKDVEVGIIVGNDGQPLDS